jgi:hypothetical protein
MSVLRQTTNGCPYAGSRGCLSVSGKKKPPNCATRERGQWRRIPERRIPERRIPERRIPELPLPRTMGGVRDRELARSIGRRGRRRRPERALLRRVESPSAANAGVRGSRVSRLSQLAVRDPVAAQSDRQSGGLVQTSPRVHALNGRCCRRCARLVANTSGSRVRRGNGP